VRIAIVGKYVELEDAYLSVAEALRHAGFRHGRHVGQRGWTFGRRCRQRDDLARRDLADHRRGDSKRHGDAAGEQIVLASDPVTINTPGGPVASTVGAVTDSDGRVFVEVSDDKVTWVGTATA